MKELMAMEGMSGSDNIKNAIRHHVFALSTLFGYDAFATQYYVSSSVDPTTDNRMLGFANKLEQSIETLNAGQINLRSAMEVLCDKNPQADVLAQKFEELKLRNARELGPFIYLYSRVKADQTLMSNLEHAYATKFGDRRTTDRNSTEVSLSCQDFNQLQQRLAESNLLSNTIERSSLRTTLLNSVDDYPIMPNTPSASQSQRTTSSCTLLPMRSSRTHVTNSIARGPVTARSNRLGPTQPDWLLYRATLYNDFLPDRDTEMDPKTPINSLSADAQEYAIVGDLLRLLQGNRGIYIQPTPFDVRSRIRTFHLDENMSPMLMDTANKILPICADYSAVVRFIDEKSAYEQGLVNHALSGAMRRLLKDYFILLCQLENEYRAGRLGLARLQFCLQDTATMFSQLARVATDIETGGCTGGAVLSLLYDSARKVYGVKQLHDLATYLLRSASVPFFEILQKWIYRGVISDTYHEFFIAAGPMPDFLQNGRTLNEVPNQLDRLANEAIDWTFFWEQHYTIVSHNLPVFLGSHLAKILNAGKYLNVVQQCADAYELPPLQTLEYDEADSAYLDQIERAHLYASSLLLKLMVKENQLKEHLSSIKRYFLLDKADFIVHFMDAAATELCQLSTEVSLLRLGSLLEIAIRTSSATVDPFKDNLKVVLYKYDLISQILMVLQAGSDTHQDSTPIEDLNLTALEAFSVDYSVAWPVSLVLNRQVMDRYQMLFRHMFYCKHVERRLCSGWVLGKLARRVDCMKSTWLTTAFLLGQRMLTFIQHFQYYMAVEVIEPTWDHFYNQIDKVSNLDALLDAHLYCLEVCMDDCLLTSPDLLSLFGKLNVVCVLFANFVQRILSVSVLDSWIADSDLSARTQPQKPLLQDPTPCLPTISTAHTTGERSWSPDSTTSGDTAFTKVTRYDFVDVDKKESFAQSIVDFDHKFNGLLVEFVDKLKHYSKERNKLSSLVSRLDFNEFYSSSANADLLTTFPAFPSGGVSTTVGSQASQQENIGATFLVTRPAEITIPQSAKQDPEDII
ncbi:Spc97 / Spc98 family protein [Opisthorchis viverrini]|uniref:Gamma-tubulin complex component n=1 Tax=Opisthorchis viverrini TaxID=6198 RepID=A0A1S8WXN5_OPIVI|nr:Spc97 / Spc98 family protein [Opisthorchis viverrini]